MSRGRVGVFLPLLVTRWSSYQAHALSTVAAAVAAPIMLFDCHAHITDASFADRDQVLEAAAAAGVRGIIAVSEGLEDAASVLEVCAAHNAQNRAVQLHPALGMHPCTADVTALPAMLDLIEQHHQSLVCIGEVGLDYSPHIVGKDDAEAAAAVKEAQREVFSQQAHAAMRHGLPVNVHSRAAGHHAIALMADLGVKNALLHAFDGKPKYALAAFEQHGYLFSVAPSICRSPGLQSLVKKLPLEALVLETDCPALGPTKGERCVPGDIAISCEWVAKTKGVTTEEVAETTLRNAKRLFPRAFS